MSNETMFDLNHNTLIGCTDKRGKAWHYRDNLQGEQSNHYPGFIPMADVISRIFNWAPQTVGVAYLVPCEETDAHAVELDGGKWYRVVPSQQNRVGVLRGDNDYDLGVFKSGVRHRPYAELIRDAEKLTGTTLGISSAGLLAQGGRAWVELSLDESVHDSKSGVIFRPNLVKADSMDGSLANTTFRSLTITVCDNTLMGNLMEANAAGAIFKRKHTSQASLKSVSDERDALSILEPMVDEFTAELHDMLAVEMNKAKRLELMDLIVPLPTDEGRARTLAENKRSQLLALDNNEMVSPWVGTAYGELSRYNTFDHHFSNIKNTTRGERNSWNALNGKRAAMDQAVLKGIERVMA